MPSQSDEENLVRMMLLMSRISQRAVRNYIDSKFLPSCLNASLRKEERKLFILKSKRILTLSQWNLLYPSNGESNSSSFDTTLMITLLRNLTDIKVNLTDDLPRNNDASKTADLARLEYYRNLLSHFEDRNMDNTFFIKAWSDIVGAVGRLGDQRILAECQELRTIVLEIQDHFIHRFKEWKMTESNFFIDTAPRGVFVSVVGSSCMGKSVLTKSLALEIANKGCKVIPVLDIHEIPSLNHTGGFCNRTLYVVDDIFQQMDIVHYESVTKGCSPSEKTLITYEDFYRNCFRLLKFENQRKLMLNIKTEKKQGGIYAHLDDRNAENSAIMKIYKHNETKKKHLGLLPFQQAKDRPNIFDEYSIESTDNQNEISMIMSKQWLDRRGCSQKSQFENISTLLKLCTTGPKANCVENRRNQHILHRKGKNIEESECYKNTDTPWKEKHVLLERVAKIEKYCDQMFAFVARSVKYSEDQTLWLEMHTEDLLKTAYKRLFQLLGTQDGNEDLCGEHMNDEEVCGISVKIGDGALEEQNQISKQQFIECQMCIDQNNALYWCNNCRMNICSFCKMYHETVWTVMNHEVYPLHLVS